MLKVLYKWCKKWNMCINIEKSAIVHFRNKSIPMCAKVFMIGENIINYRHDYKYLGVTFNQFMCMNEIVKTVAQSASRALGLIIAKSKIHGGFPYEVYTKLYNALVVPIF